MPENLVVCSKCGGVNRLPPSRPAIGAKCGKCGAKVFVGHPGDVDAEIFDRQIARSTMPVLVDVWAPWCGPCIMMAPAYEAAARELVQTQDRYQSQRRREHFILRPTRGLLCNHSRRALRDRCYGLNLFFDSSSNSSICLEISFRCN
jgi:hypothetical protein